MRANVHVMVARHDEIVSALKQARDLIAARGYQPLFGSATEGGPINISYALTRSCADDYELQLLCRQSFSQNWGGPIAGLIYWETDRRRSLADVMALFEKVLQRLETDEARPTGSAPRRSGVRAT